MKEKELMDTDNSVVTAAGGVGEWVEVEEGTEGIHADGAK